mmetsp:Transcript_113477/g.179352  ORF Transcript_113477/g.179352 Transcript_113477/m.179352 type:complete len:201 (-) Transcript_113477:200-802(-)
MKTTSASTVIQPASLTSTSPKDWGTLCRSVRTKPCSASISKPEPSELPVYGPSVMKRRSVRNLTVTNDACSRRIKGSPPVNIATDPGPATELAWLGGGGICMFKSVGTHLSGSPLIPLHCHCRKRGHLCDIFAKPIFNMRSRRKSASSYHDTGKYCLSATPLIASANASKVGTGFPETAVTSEVRPQHSSESKMRPERAR